MHLPHISWHTRLPTTPFSSVTTSLSLSLCLSFSPAFDHITHSTSLSPVIVPLLSCRCLSNACSIFPPHPLQFSLSLSLFPSLILLLYPSLSFFCQLVSVTITFHISVLFPCSSVSPRSLFLLPLAFLLLCYRFLTPYCLPGHKLLLLLLLLLLLCCCCNFTQSPCSHLFVCLPWLRIKLSVEIVTPFPIFLSLLLCFHSSPISSA